MPRVLVHGDWFGAVEQSKLESMFRLRYRVLVERLGWTLKGTGGLECDQFDELDPVYILIEDRGKIVGSARLLRTTGPNMLRDVFAHVLDGRSAPDSPLIWESTRFVVDKEALPSRTDGLVSRATSYLLAGIWEVALAAGLQSITSVMTPGMGHVLQRAGCRMRVIGGPRTIGTNRLIAALFPVDSAALNRIQQAGGIDSLVLPKLKRAATEVRRIALSAADS